MYEIDPVAFPPKMTELLMTRGTATPPLQWSSYPNRMAKANLERLDDPRLFGRQSFADPGSAKTVRGLLFLWTGWSKECLSAAATAPPTERAYLEGLCARQDCRPDEAKIFFGQHEGYCIHEPLAAWAIKLIGDRTDPLITRFKQMLEMTGTWEPHLFVDLCEQGRAGKLDGPAMEAVRQIQVVEFELLLRHSYELAIGERLSGRGERPVKTDRAENLERMRRLAEKHRPKPSTRDRAKAAEAQSANKEEPAPAEDPSTNSIRVTCPKCRGLLVIRESARGEIERCGRCNTAFQVPREAGKKPGDKPPVPPGNPIGVRCPKCKAMLSLPDTARGATERCIKCGTPFLVPTRQPAPARA